MGIYEDEAEVIEKGERLASRHDEQVVVCDDKTTENAIGDDDKVAVDAGAKALKTCEISECSANRRNLAKQSRRESTLRGPKKVADPSYSDAKQPKLAQQQALERSTSISQQAPQVAATTSQNKLNAEARLGNAIVSVPGLYDLLDNKVWPNFKDAYERAINVEHKRPGNGIKYLIGAVRREAKRKRDRNRGRRKNRRQ